MKRIIILICLLILCLGVVVKRGPGSGSGDMSQSTYDPDADNRVEDADTSAAFRVAEQDQILDCDNANTTQVGTCQTLSEGDTLIAMDSSASSLGILCTDDIDAPTRIWVDSDQNCDSVDGTTAALIGSVPGAGTQDTPIDGDEGWAYKDTDADTDLGVGEPLLIDRGTALAYDPPASWLGLAKPYHDPLASTDCTAEAAIYEGQLCRDTDDSPQTYWIAEAAGAAGAATWVQLTRSDSLNNDHGSLGGLGDDDHTQYATQSLQISHFTNEAALQDGDCATIVDPSSTVWGGGCTGSTTAYESSVNQTVTRFAIALGKGGAGKDFTGNEECRFDLEVSTDSGGTWSSTGAVLVASDGAGADFGSFDSFASVAVGQALSAGDYLRVKAKNPVGGSETCTGASCACSSVEALFRMELYTRRTGASR